MSHISSGARERAASCRRHRRSRRAPGGYLTVADLAAECKFSKATLYNDIRARRLPVHKWRGKFVISEADAAALFGVKPVSVGSEETANA